ncbi:MAG: hypothetical protein K2P84_07355 [Undibacterium sp.]|nr:hypothetical protein [Undibacterium sp.]
MGLLFWIRRFITVFVVAFILIAGAQMLRGHDIAYALEQGLIWSFISSSIFVISRFIQARNKKHCALCRDTPEMQ